MSRGVRVCLASGADYSMPMLVKSSAATTSVYRRMTYRAPRRSRRRHGDAIEREPLVPFAILPHEFYRTQRERLAALFRMHGVLHIAPEIPVDIDPAGVPAGQVAHVCRVRGDQRQLPGIGAPDMKHGRVVSEDIGVRRQAGGKLAGRTHVRT